MRVGEMLVPEAVMTNIGVASMDAAVTELVGALGRARGVDVEMAMRDIAARDRAGRTLIPFGSYRVGIPHTLTKACKQFVIAVGTSRKGVPCGSGSSEMTQLIFVLLGPPQTHALHLRVLSRIARLCRSKGFIASLLDAQSTAELLERVQKTEEPLGEIAGVEGMPRFCVLGAGPGGMAMAGHLAITGCQINLFNRSPDRIVAIQARGGVDLTGEVKGFASLSVVTSDVAAALEGADVLMVVTPATAHRNIAEMIAPHLKDGQIVVLNPGRTGGALEVAKVIQSLNPSVRP
jgi:mannitol/fructose-specific phosphotransferase system IIA component (Ntr-type)